MKIYFFLAVLAIPLLGRTQSFSISGKIGKADTVSLFIWDHLFSESKRMLTPHRVLEQKSISGSFHFQADRIYTPVYISLNAGSAFSSKPGELLKLYITEPGDSIEIEFVSRNQMRFSGKGSSRYEYQYRLDSLTENINEWFSSDHARYTDFQNKHYLNFEKSNFRQVDSLLSAQLSLLALYKPSLCEEAYQLLEAELIGKSVQNKYISYWSLIKLIKSNNSTSNEQTDTTALYDTFIQSVNQKKINVPDSVLAISKEYCRSRIQLAMAAETKATHLKADAAIRKDYDGILEEKLLATYLIDNFDFIPAADSVLASAIQNIQTPWCR